MLARVFSCAVIGLDGVVVEVEVDTAGGLPKMVIVSILNSTSHCICRHILSQVIR
jgi:magnesium chelatase family protein